MEDVIKKLKELGELLKSGAISQEEFQVLKKELLNSAEMSNNENEENNENSEAKIFSKQSQHSRSNSDSTNSMNNQSVIETKYEKLKNNRFLLLTATVCIVGMVIYLFDFFEIYYLIYAKEVEKQFGDDLFRDLFSYQDHSFFLISIIPISLFSTQLVLNSTDNSYLKKPKLYFENLAYPFALIFILGFVVNLSINIFFEVISVNSVAIFFSSTDAVGLLFVGFLPSMLFFMFWLFSIRAFFKGLKKILNESNYR